MKKLITIAIAILAISCTKENLTPSTNIVGTWKLIACQLDSNNVRAVNVQPYTPTTDSGVCYFYKDGTAYLFYKLNEPTNIQKLVKYVIINDTLKLTYVGSYGGYGNYKEEFFIKQLDSDTLIIKFISNNIQYVPIVYTWYMKKLK